VAERIRVIVGVALMLGALVFASVGLTVAFQHTDTFRFGPGTTFHTGFRRNFMVLAIVGGVFVVVGIAAWVPPVRRWQRAFPRWTGVLGVLLAPVAVVIPVAVSAVALNLFGGHVRVTATKAVAPATTTTSTSPFVTCDPTRTTCGVPSFKVRETSVRWPIARSELMALVVGLVVIVVGWWWAASGRAGSR